MGKTVIRFKAPKVKGRGIIAPPPKTHSTKKGKKGYRRSDNKKAEREASKP